MDDTRVDDDQPDDDAPAASAPTGGDDGSRLDELGERIQSARSTAEEAVEGVAHEDDEKFAESGSDRASADDDQTIAPPG